jgi:hypothetical protein
MKPLLVALLLVFLSGCNTTPERIGAAVQSMLDVAFPADFTGDGYFDEEVTGGVRLTIRAGNLRRVDGKWSYSWLVWKRNGVWTRGTFIAGSPPAHLIP